MKGKCFLRASRKGIAEVKMEVLAARMKDTHRGSAGLANQQLASSTSSCKREKWWFVAWRALRTYWRP